MTALRRSFVIPRGVIFCVFVITFLNSVNARPVNISNTWILPEEGFPVFYRYFRDRISWYEADAVCQFHHANLVTVDTTAQYDAARAYLKELDIMSNVWIGLIKSNEEGDFAWTDYKPLSGEGYWATAPAEGRTPLCTALDPAKDYRWSALSCGGPQVASFICELPVPTWALKPEGGCLVKSLPSLTVQFLPELAAVQLISDCGLDGTKKVTCKSNESHSDVLKELSCAIAEDDFSDNQITTSDDLSSGSTNPSHLDIATFTTSIPGDYSTRIRRETIPTSPPLLSTSIPQIASKDVEKSQSKPLQTIPVQVIMSQATTLPPKQQEVELTPKINDPALPIKSSTPHSEITDESLVSENPTKPSITTTPASIISTVSITPTEKHDVSKTVPANTNIKTTVPVTNPNAEEKLKPKEHHDNIYNAPTDHFIPPLVMAKSKVSTDMTVVTLEEKHLQQKINHNKQSNSEHVDETKKQDTLTSSKPIVMSTDIPVISTIIESISTTTQKTVTPKPKPLIVQPPATTTTSTVPPPSTTTNQQESITVTDIEKHIEDNVINDAKLKKPGKGKKYDKLKEEKKKYKDVTLPNKQELSNKVIAVTIPSTSVKSTPFTVIEITTKAVEQQSTTTTVSPSSANIISSTVVTKPAQENINIQTATPQSVNNGTTPDRTNDEKQTIMMIDPNILVLNKLGNVNINNDSENIHQNITNQSKPQIVKKTDQLIPKKEKLIIKTNKVINKTIPNEKTTESIKVEEKMEATLDPIPRPNRSRTLTQPPQHRSFYPYFFNRVLG